MSARSAMLNEQTITNPVTKIDASDRIKLIQHSLVVSLHLNYSPTRSYSVRRNFCQSYHSPQSMIRQYISCLLTSLSCSWIKV